MTSRWIASTHQAIGQSAVTGAAAALVACVAASMLLACTTMGIGTGTVTPGNTPVAFSWTSKDGGNTGTMSATLGTDGTFTGPFLQATSTVQSEGYEPLWAGWQTGWADWGYWDGFPGFPGTTFTTSYSGKVLANLQGPDTQRLRCSFQLNNPPAGMGGGGQGQCQFSSGRTVDAVFPRS
jgi:hypothetical protein